MQNKTPETKTPPAEESVEAPRRQWRSIKIPAYLHEKIKSLASRAHTHQYKVIEQAVNNFELYLRRPYRKSELPRIDKASWYIFKLAQSVGAFKENNSKENYDRLLRTIMQIEKRLEIELNELKDVVARVNPERKKQLTSIDKMDLNGATKIAIADIILKLLYEQPEEGAEEGSE